jgi:signal peptidase I
LRTTINPLLTIIVTSTIITSGCLSVEDFSNEESQFVKPFQEGHQLVFKSSKGQQDTIVFSAASIDTIKYRNIEQGYYNELALSVTYRLSPGSFHKITVKSINDEPETFIQFTKAKDSHSSKEISFLGLIFDEKYIHRIVGQRKDVFDFRKEDAVYSGVNINEGIKSFVFSLDAGIISFIDNYNTEWQRQNE